MQSPKLSLQESLRRYWTNLIGFAVFPPFAWIAVEEFHIRGAFILPLFFAVSWYAARPVLKGRAPYLFWVVAMAVWMSAGLITSIAFAAITAR